MNDRDVNAGGGPTPDPRDDEALAALLDRAGHRPEVPPEDLAAIKAAARKAWRQKVAEGKEEAAAEGSAEGRPPELLDSRLTPSFRHRSALLAAAAAFLLVAGLAWIWLRASPQGGAQLAATVEKIEGELLRHPAGGQESSTVATGSVLEPGVTLSSTDSAALRLASGASLRLASGSQIRLEGPAGATLEAGALYVDSAPAVPGEVPGGGEVDGAPEARDPVTIYTAFGSVTHVGSQFEVRLVRDPEQDGGRALRVRVREGTILVDQAAGQGGTEPVRLTPGEELTVTADGNLSHGSVPLHGDPWTWAVASAPSLKIEGLPLSDFLTWVSRETGWRLSYEEGEAPSPALEEEAKTIVLHGSIEGLSPEEAPAAVLPGTGLQYEIGDGRLAVFR